MLEPMVSTLQTVEQVMCGGNLKFVWNLDKRGVVLLSPTTGGGWEAEAESIKKPESKSVDSLCVQLLVA